MDKRKSGLRSFRMLMLSLVMIFGVLILSSGTARAEESATTGDIGQDATWTFDSGSGTLTISGKGEMDNYWMFGPFRGISGLTKVTIEEGITQIGAFAFQNCRSLTTVEIPSSVTTIKESAFSNCTSLPSIEIPSTVTTIEKDTFGGCSGLKTVNILSGSLETLEEHLFYGCTSLTSIIIPSNVTTIGTGVFHYDEKLSKIFILGKNLTISYFQDYAPNAKIYAYSDSSAKNYAEGSGLGFQALDTWLSVKDIPAQMHTGSALNPDVVVKDEGDNTPLILGTNYKVEYNNNTNIGNNSATATITGLGVYQYATPVTKTFSIVNKKISVGAILFGEATEGGSWPEKREIMISNLGTANATIESISLQGGLSSNFEVTQDPTTGKYYIQPKTGLLADASGISKTYTDTIKVTYDATAGNENPATATVTFTVNPIESNVKVVNGTPESQVYAKGKEVTITANEPDTGYLFDEWEVIRGGVTLKDSNNSTTTFTMPGEDVEVEATYRKDIIAPEITIKAGDNNIDIEANDIAYDAFFRESKRITIDYTDSETGIKTQQYFITDKILSDKEIADISDWTTYSEEFEGFDLGPNRKQVIYAKAVDQADNVTIVNVGVVVYTDSVLDTTSLTHILAVDGNGEASVQLNGNTIQSISEGETELNVGTDYTVSEDGTISLSSDYLDGLSVGTHSLTIRYNPYGETYVEKTTNNAPAESTLAVLARKPKVTEVIAPDDFTSENGVALEEMKLPSEVTIETEDPTITKASVEWNLTELASGSYDPSLLCEQSFTLNGTITFPEQSDENQQSTETQIKVTVKNGAISKLTASLKRGTYKTNQNVRLSSDTKGVVIYYTADGSTPSETNGIKYTGAIGLKGLEGKKVTRTIKAMAVKDGIESAVVTFVYKISLPVKTPAKVLKPKVEKMEKSFVISWKKVSGATGYQVQFKKTGQKSWKNIKRVTKLSKTKWRTENYIKGRTYQYRIRAYRVVNGKKAYGKWSKAVKIRK